VDILCRCCDEVEIHEIELVARIVARNNVGDESSRSPTLPKVVDE
jgi:hypothetical protein